MSNPPLSRTDDYFIYSFYCNNEAQIAIPAIAQILQESAWLHAESCDLGYHALKKDGLLWVLSGLKIRIMDSLSWGDSLKLKTWGRSYDSLFAYRDFQVTESDEANPKILATSSWLVIQEKSRRPVRITPQMQKIIPYDNPLEMSTPGKIELPTKFEFSRDLKVLFSDIDVYNHVNNTRYIQWCIDSLDDYHKARIRISEFEIRFVSETHLNDNVVINFSKDDHQYYFVAKNQNSSKEIFRARASYNSIK